MKLVATATGPTAIPAAYAVAGDPFFASRLEVLALRAETTSASGSTWTGVTFKLQTARLADGATNPADTRWSDVSLDAVNGVAAATEHDRSAADGMVQALDRYSQAQHRGRGFFRILVKRLGGTAPGASDKVEIWINER